MTTNEKYAMNRTIGEFMGGKVISSTSYDTSSSELLIENWKVPEGIPAYDDSAKIGYFNYDLHWDRLMTVVEKIDKMGYTVMIHRTTCKIIEDFKIYPMIERIGNTKIESVYLAVSDFIKNYNHEEFEKMHEKENNSI
jgi:hypothetical protein